MEDRRSSVRSRSIPTYVSNVESQGVLGNPQSIDLASVIRPHAANRPKAGMLRLRREDRFALLTTPLSMTVSFLSLPAFPCHPGSRRRAGSRQTWIEAELRETRNKKLFSS